MTLKAGLIIFAIGLLIGLFSGYFVKDNYSQPDNVNKIKQKGRCNKISLFGLGRKKS